MKIVREVYVVFSVFTNESKRQSRTEIDYVTFDESLARERRDSLVVELAPVSKLAFEVYSVGLKVELPNICYPVAAPESSPADEEITPMDYLTRKPKEISPSGAELTLVDENRLLWLCFAEVQRTGALPEWFEIVFADLLQDFKDEAE